MALMADYSSGHMAVLVRGTANTSEWYTGVQVCCLINTLNLLFCCATCIYISILIAIYFQMNYVHSQLLILSILMSCSDVVLRCRAQMNAQIMLR